MNELIVVKYKEQKVLTTAQVAEAYNVETKKITDNFNNNKDRYVEGKHYICLQGQELRDFKSETENLGFAPNLNKLYLWTERGCLLHAKSLGTDEAWEVYERLMETYFRVKEIVNAELSPELQMLQGLLSQMVQKELADKERDRQIAIAQETASKAVETTEKIKEEMVSPFDNWRDDVNAKVREIAIKSNIPYRDLFGTMYKELESKAGCDLAVRQRNKRDRMNSSGCRKGDIDKETSKIAIIEEDKKLKQIFEGIVRQYSMKYCA